MKKRCWLFIVAIVLLFAVTTTLHAALVNFTPEVFVSEEYTDNLFLDFDDDAKVDDYITTAGLGLIGEVIGRTAGLELEYSPSYNSFADNDDLDYWRHFASLLAYKNFRRNTRLELSSTFLESEDPRDESNETLEEGSVDGPAIGRDTTRRDRTRYRRNVNDLRLTHQYGANNSIYAAIVYNIYEDIDPPDGILVDDVQELQPAFGFEHWFTQRWGVAIDTYVANRDYEDRDDRVEYYGSIRVSRSFNRRLSGFVEYQHTILDFDQETEDEDYQLYAPSIGIDYQLRESTDIRVGAGYYIQDLDEADDEEGFFINSELVNRWNYRTGYVRLIAGSGYDVDDIGAQDLGLQLYYEGRLEAGHNFSSKTTGDIYASYRYDDYLNVTPDRTDQTFNAGTGISYQTLRWLRFRLAYDYQDVTSDIETQEYTENRVLFTITMSPSSPYRLN